MKQIQERQARRETKQRDRVLASDLSIEVADG
jgi:hypothetical protein